MKDHDEEIAALNALVREAHEAIKDLTALMRQAERVGDELRNVIHTEFQAQMNATAESVMADYSDHVMAAVKTSEAAVFKRFDELSAALLDVTKSERRRGFVGLEDLVQVPPRSDQKAREAATREARRLVD
jgi:hypothetical protein